MFSRSLLLLGSSWLAFAVAACAGPHQRAVVGTRPTTSADQNGSASAAALTPPQVRLRIDGGKVSEPVVHPAFGKATLCLRFPVGFEGRELELVVDRIVGSDTSEWLRLRPRVRNDGTLQLAGLSSGRYALRVESSRVVVLTGTADLEAPERIEVTMREVAASPGRRRPWSTPSR